MNILIADDHELFLEGLNLVLRSHFPQANIFAVKNYTELFDTLNKNHFDVVITDLAMPGANSMDALSQMHNILKDTPIIVICAVLTEKLFKRPLKSAFPDIFRNHLQMI